VTKQIVGLLLARTIVDRMADADDRVVRWLPELPDWMASVRLRHLIHHTANLPEVTDPALGVPGSNLEVIERIQLLQPKSLPQPVVRYAYSNVGTSFWLRRSLGYGSSRSAISRRSRSSAHWLS